MQVRAIKQGFYDGSLRAIGEAFEIESDKELGLWMEPADKVVAVPAKPSKPAKAAKPHTMATHTDTIVTTPVSNGKRVTDQSVI